MNKKLLVGEKLLLHAQKLGVPLSQTCDDKGNRNWPELQRRVQEAERSIREGKLWVVAVISAIAAAFSAIAAWVAVMYR